MVVQREERGSTLTFRDGGVDVFGNAVPRQPIKGNAIGCVVSQQQHRGALMAKVGKVESVQRGLEEGTEKALKSLSRAIQAEQSSAFEQLRTQFSQLALENRQLREELGRGSGPEQSGPRTDASPPEPSQMLQSTAKATRPPGCSTPGGDCPVLESIETLTLPHALHAFTEPPQPPSSNAWPSTGGYGEVVLSGSLKADADPCQTLCITHTMADPHQMKLAQIMQTAEEPREKKLAQVREGMKLAQFASRKSIHQVPANNSRRRLFPDKSELMKTVQDNLSKPEYKVANFYHKTGHAQWIAKHNVFEYVTIAVIMLNSIWIAIDTDYNPNPLEAPLGFIIVENLFCAYFFVELVFRFAAFEFKRNCIQDYWFVFDFILVTVAVLETWVMVLVGAVSGVTTTNLIGRSGPLLRLLRMARLARTARMARLLRAVPEVLIICKGMVVASHAVICTIIMLALIIYVFALCFRQLTADTVLEQSHFRSVPASMGSLLLRGTLPDTADFIYDLSGTHLLLGVAGMGFALLTILVVLNMLAGVLVNVVLVVAELEKEEADAILVRGAIGQMLDLGDLDGDKTISKQELEELLQNTEATALLKQINVDVLSLLDLRDFIFLDCEEGLIFEDFFKLLLDLRGTKFATVKDLVQLQKFIALEMSTLENDLHSTLKKILAQVSIPSGPEMLQD